MPRRQYLIATACVLALTARVAAQNQTAPRAIPLPDTMGANFSIADSATARSHPTDFDFLVGLWEFTFQQRRPDGAFTPAFKGHWRFSRKESEGAFIEDHWRADDPGAAWDDGTWTYRTFSPERGIWEMQGVNTSAGRWQPGLMWSDGADRLVIEWYGPDVVRFRYFAITADHFLWRADRSTDRGRTWLRDSWTMDVKRISR